MGLAVPECVAGVFCWPKPSAQARESWNRSREPQPQTLLAGLEVHCRLGRGADRARSSTQGATWSLGRTKGRATAIWRAALMCFIAVTAGIESPVRLSNAAERSPELLVIRVFVVNATKNGEKRETAFRVTNDRVGHFLGRAGDNETQTPVRHQNGGDPIFAFGQLSQHFLDTGLVELVDIRRIRRDTADHPWRRTSAEVFDDGNHIERFTGGRLPFDGDVVQSDPRASVEFHLIQLPLHGGQLPVKNYRAYDAAEGNGRRQTDHPTVASVNSINKSLRGYGLLLFGCLCSVAGVAFGYRRRFVSLAISFIMAAIIAFHTIALLL
jgi:hypothetical protein